MAHLRHWAPMATSFELDQVHPGREPDTNRPELFRLAQYPSLHLLEDVPMITITCLASLSCLSPQTPQEGSAAVSPITFAEPIQVIAGDEAIGGLYPSPTLFDIDGDGAAELVIGDLFGNIQYAERLSGDDLGAWGELKPFKTGERELKFNNW